MWKTRLFALDRTPIGNISMELSTEFTTYPLKSVDKSFGAAELGLFVSENPRFDP